VGGETERHSELAEESRSRRGTKPNGPREIPRQARNDVYFTRLFSTDYLNSFNTKNMPPDYTEYSAIEQVINAEIIWNHFGYWPNFHDAEIIKVVFETHQATWRY